MNNEYIIIEPVDKSVAFNKANAEYFEPLVYKEKYIETVVDNEQIDKMKQEIVDLKNKIASIEDSRTWKIMQPIRNIKKFLKFKI